VDYDLKLDEYIIEVLEENGGTKRYFNDLIRLLNERYYTKATKLRPRTLTKHLNIMEKQKIIERDPKKPYKRYVWLHPNTIIQRKYHIFKGVEGVKSAANKEEEKEERERKLALFLIFFLGYGRDKVLGNPKDLKFLHYKEPGFLPSDIKSDAFGTSPLQTLLAFNRFSSDERDRMFREITSIGHKHHEIPMNKILSSDEKEIGYRINDDILQYFLYWCVEVLVALIRRMEKEWYLLTKKPKKDEKNWAYFVCGKDYLTYLFMKIEENKSTKKTVKELFISYFYQDWKDDPQRIERHMRTTEKTFPDYFTKPGILKQLETDDRKIQQTLEFFDSNKAYFLQIKSRYAWILRTIKDIIRPTFSKKMYVSEYFDSDSKLN
jgi:DNA-binding HxlR family transcriptional regulator